MLKLTLNVHLMVKTSLICIFIFFFIFLYYNWFLYFQINNFFFLEEKNHENHPLSVFFKYIPKTGAGMRYALCPVN